MKIYIVDRIGNNSGMHYYNKSFAKILKDNGFQCKIITNYNCDVCTKIIGNLYSGKLLARIINLFISLIKYYKHKYTHKKSDCIYIYQVFGSKLIDFLFMLNFPRNIRFIIDVHDLYNIKSKKSNILIRNYYKSIPKTIVYHSNKTCIELESIGYKKKKIFMPHIKYNFDKTYDNKKIEIIKECINDSKINLLFFGTIRKSKGLNMFIDWFSKLDTKIKNKYNIIIAGRDVDNVLPNIYFPKNISHSVYNRRINDDEMKYLFQNADYILLPYTNIYQSGVLEMAKYYNKKSIMLENDYFNSELKSNRNIGYVYNNKNYISVFGGKLLKKNDIIKDNSQEVEIYNFINYLKSLTNTNGR